jgi:hypothetical protein
LQPMTIFLNIWAAVGPLLGVALGSWLTTRNQRRQWILDNKRAEYRKLLTTLTDCGTKFIVFYGAMPAVMEAKEQRMIGETARKSANVIYNRLFVASEMEKLNIDTRWQNAISTLQNSHDGVAFARDLDGIMDDIRRAALKDFS